jgi:sterol desaturase/sphingolipid hydroxylase (fatty acid hydroxylase superfamily)
VDAGEAGLLESEEMNYAAWLLGFSLLFVALERIWPRRREQRPLRRGFGWDVVYLIFNSEYLGVLLGAAAVPLAAWAEREAGWLQAGWMNGRPVALQFVVLLLVFDLAQWGIHNLLHRAPWLWRLQQVHHSIEEMDWIGNWRFHWAEVAVYRVLLYPLAALFGFGVEAMFGYGLFNTLAGHFAHSNLRWRTGWLKYLVNSPEMHIWHHAHPAAGPADRNFGIALSVWDWVFGTAYLPAGEDPERLGFSGIERYLGDPVRQAVEPFRKRSKA